MLSLYDIEFNGIPLGIQRNRNSTRLKFSIIPLDSKFDKKE
jgi:hypothetical protein